MYLYLYLFLKVKYNNYYTRIIHKHATRQT